MVVKLSVRHKFMLSLWHYGAAGVLCFVVDSRRVQIIGALIVAAGVCLAAAPSDAGANIFQQVCLARLVAQTITNVEVSFSVPPYHRSAFDC